MKFYNNISFIPAFMMLLILKIVAHRSIFVYVDHTRHQPNSPFNGLSDRKLMIDHITSEITSLRRHPPNKPHPLKFDIQNFLNFYIIPKIQVINSKLS